MVKYTISYNDVINRNHRVTIENDDYTGEPIAVNGTVVLDYGSIDNLLDPIRGSGLKITLDADETLTFEDLFSESERVNKVTYYYDLFSSEDSPPSFVGFVNPEGWYEDWVNDKWQVTFDCVDGIGYLKDLSFVDENGVPFIGKMSQADIIHACLDRIGLGSSDFYSSVNIFYTGLDPAQFIFSNVYVDVGRYIKDDGNTIMSCDEVLRDILEPYGAVLTPYFGSYFIYKPNEYYTSNNIDVFYDLYVKGQETTVSAFELIRSYNIGTDGTDDEWFIHANGNQSITNERSVAGFRISYKYGTRQSLSDNPNFYTADGNTYDGWVVDSPLNVSSDGPDTYGAYFDGKILQTRIDLLTSEAFTLQESNVINVRFKFDASYVEQTNVFYGSFVYQIFLVDGGTTYYMNSVREWGTSERFITSPILGETSFNVFTRTSPLPADGDLFIRIVQPDQQESPRANTDFTIKMTDFILSFDEDFTDLIVEGETHTFERTNSGSSRILENKEVFTGDIPNEIYIGTTYKNDQNTPTETWYRKGFEDDNYPLLRIMGEETMRMNQGVSKIFSGDVFGYVPYISVINVLNVNSDFQILNYSYDSYNNITSLTLKQAYGDELTDLEYNVFEDFGNVVTPTIKS